jgi:hypothetical protein
MSTTTTDVLLLEFDARLRAGNRQEALELIEPELPDGDLRLVLNYAKAKLEDGDGFTAAALLMRRERDLANSHYALLAAASARFLIKQVKEWGERAEQELLHIIKAKPEQEGLLTQLKHYLQLCELGSVPPHPEIRVALSRLDPTISPNDPVRVTFLGYHDGRPHKFVQNLSAPAAPMFLESDTTDWRPRVARSSNIDVDDQDFKYYENVLLYMLPGMYGLIEIGNGRFLGTDIGGCNPHLQQIVTRRGGQFYKNIAEPLLTENAERQLSGTWMVPFRLAGTYYFHFAVETLQNIEEFQQRSASIPIILPRSPGFFDRIPRDVHDSAVEAVRVDGQRYEFLEDGIYRIDQVVVPTRIKYGNTTYQRRVLSKLGLPNEDTPRVNVTQGEILYIARRPGMVRAVTNDEDLVAYLRSRFPAFRRVYLEEMSFSDQAAAFREASIIIAPHGGGLTNMLFCEPGTAIIEFHLPDTGIMYWHLACVQKLRYLAYIPEWHEPASLRYRIKAERLIAAIKAVSRSEPLDLDRFPDELGRR